MVPVTVTFSVGRRIIKFSVGITVDLLSIAFGRRRAARSYGGYDDLPPINLDDRLGKGRSRINLDLPPINLDDRLGNYRFGRPDAA